MKKAKNITIRISVVALIVLAIATEQVFACDLCSMYNASRLQARTPKSFGISVNEQFTSFDRAEGLPENSIRDGELVRGFSTTQFGFSYDLNQKLGFDLIIPFMGRRFDRIKQFRNETGSDSDIGDIILTSTYSILDYKDETWGMILEMTGGFKLPSGDTGALEDVSEEEQAPEPLVRHHTIAGASGGRALTFGSGSLDYILGLNFLSRYKRTLFLTTTQYTLRTEGDFNYEFGDDFLVSIVPGYYFWLGHDFTLAGALSFTGEFKNADDLAGERVRGSAVSNIYVGPAILMTLSDYMGVEIGLDFRTSGEDAGSSVVPETRFRSSLSYRFS